MSEFWYLAGIAAESVRQSRRRDIPYRDIIGVATAVYLAAEVVRVAQGATVDASESRPSSPQPPTTPLRETMLQMPTHSVHQATTTAWPPFEGVRVPLGGDSA